MLEVQVEVMQGHGTTCLVCQYPIQCKPARYRSRLPCCRAWAPSRSDVLIVELTSVILYISPLWPSVPQPQPVRNLRHTSIILLQPNLVSIMVTYSKVLVLPFGSLPGRFSSSTNENRSFACHKQTYDTARTACIPSVRAPAPQKYKIPAVWAALQSKEDEGSGPRGGVDNCGGAFHPSM